MNNHSELINNRYRVVRDLGKGGFGATFLVEDTQLPSGKRFVLKELRPIENNEETYTLIKQRFEREAVILEELGTLADIARVGLCASSHLSKFLPKIGRN